MNSGVHRGFTVVTIITLIFAPFFSHHEWMWRLVGQTKEIIRDFQGYDEHFQ